MAKSLERYYIWNKFCSIFNQHPEQQFSHTYFWNWNDSAAAMETDIIAEGFKNVNSSIASDILRTFIGDRDSSVYSSLIEAVSWGYSITKVIIY